MAQAALAQAEADFAELLEEQGSPPRPGGRGRGGTEGAVRPEPAGIGPIWAGIRHHHRALAGYVAQVLAEPGDGVEPRTEILEIVDTTIVEVDGIVDEIDVLLVQVGTAAEVSLDACLA